MATRQTIRTASASVTRPLGPAQVFTLLGKRLVVIEEDEYEQLRAAAGIREAALPELPIPGADGNVPALEYSRVSLARKIILARKGKGLTQGQLAKLAGVRIETVNRIENGKHTPDVATIDKLQRALHAAEPPHHRRRARGPKSR